jgi:hypothetical protein
LSDAVIIGLCASVPATIAAVASLVIAIRTGKKVDIVEHQTNSMHQRLMAAEYKRGAEDERSLPR